MKEQVVVIMTDDDLGYWSIYSESGQAIEHDFGSEYQAVEFASINGYEVVDTFN